MSNPCGSATAGGEAATVPVGGVEMAYRSVGEGRPLLLVHGNYGSKRWFEEQLRDPAPGWRYIAPDLPNFAQSGDLPGEISIAAYARHLAAFCDALGLDDLVLLGHSLGGAVVQALALDEGERVKGLVLVASASPSGHFTSEEHIALLDSFVGNREGLHAALAATIPSGLPDYFPAIVDDALQMRAPAYTGNARALAAFDVSDRTASFTNPVLVVRGALDLPHLITEEIARATAAAYPDATLELWDDVGHSPQIEAPGRFNALLRRFLEEDL